MSSIQQIVTEHFPRVRLLKVRSDVMVTRLLKVRSDAMVTKPLFSEEAHVGTAWRVSIPGAQEQKASLQ